jgi:biopolymer transport protein ExbD
MRFKRQRRGSDIPTVNLVPMLDVLMVVLTFFIIVSMTLTLQQGVEVQLPSQDNPPTPEEPEPKVAIVKLNPDGEILFNDEPTPEAALTAEVKAFLQENPKGVVVLQAAEKLPYEQVVTLLGEMKAVGGERVSLAIE